MSFMFHGCSSLTSIDLSSFNTSNVTDMYRMFLGCNELTTIYTTAGFDTTNVTSGGEMFKNCVKLKGGGTPQTAYDSSHIDKEYARIDGGSTSATPGYFSVKP